MAKAWCAEFTSSWSLTRKDALASLRKGGGRREGPGATGIPSAAAWLFVSCFRPGDGLGSRS